MENLTITQVGRFLVVTGEIPHTKVEQILEFMRINFNAFSDPYTWVWKQRRGHPPHAEEAEFIQM